MDTLRRSITLAALCAVAGTLAAPAAAQRRLMVAAPLGFGAPAGDAVAGPTSANDTFGRILPSGRIVHPTGTSVVVGMNALGVVLTPDNRFAIVSNDDEREPNVHSALDPSIAGGYSLAVVDTQSMRVVDRYTDPKESFFVGLAAVRDPVDPTRTLVLASGGGSNTVYALDLDAAGHLTPDAEHIIDIPAAKDRPAANAGRAFPSSLVLSDDDRRAFVIDELGNSVAQIDTATRSVVGTQPEVGFFPLGAALTRQGLLVANEGLMNYTFLATPATAPPFVAPPPAPDTASSLSLIGRNPDGSLGAVLTASVPMDRTPDGIQEAGGAHPAAIAAQEDGAFAYVAMSNVDRIATVGLSAQPRVVGGTELRLYDRGPYGTQPSALALTRDGKRLYVALAGIDAVAVLDTSDPVHPHRLGLVPTGWYPAALALSSDDRTLFVANAKGIAEDRAFRGDEAEFVDGRGRIESVGADSNAIWSTLERVNVAGIDLRRTTPRALSYLRRVHAARKSGIVPDRFAGHGSARINHVVILLEENKTYDSMLGDLTDGKGRPYGPGDPALVSFDASVTPNLHALARRYALAGNFYADAEESDAGHQFVAGGIASLFTERTLLVKGGRRPLVDKNEDPEDYPRPGYIFNSLASRHKTYRDYGDFVRVSGYDDGAASDPTADDPNFVDPADTTAATQGLGGLYLLDAPASPALAGHIDLNYPGWNLRIRDVRRASEFVRDFNPLVRANAMPAFTYVWLPDDHGGFGADIPPLPEEVADGDRALGRIVEYLTHIPQWKSTAIFIEPDDAQSTRDHIDEHRSYAIVVSPYAKRHYIGRAHLSTVSILKTEEEVLGLPALSLGDALATDMANFFTPRANFAPYNNIDASTQTASAEGNGIARFLARTDQSAPDADSDRTARLIELSRVADRLAAERLRWPRQTYERDQRELYARARNVVTP